MFGLQGWCVVRLAVTCCCYGLRRGLDHLCVTFTEHHLWPQAIALATMNTSLLNTYSHAEYLGGHVAKLGCVKLPTDSGHSITVNWASLHATLDTSTAGPGC